MVVFYASSVIFTSLSLSLFSRFFKFCYVVRNIIDPKCNGTKDNKTKEPLYSNMYRIIKFFF